MRVLSVNPADPRQDRVDAALAALRDGQVLAMPTETFYALVVDAGNRAALSRVNRLKGKAEDAPILLLLGRAGQARQLCDALPERFEALAQMFWPGPLSLVIPACATVPREVTGGRGTVAVRVPGLALPRRLASELGGPISGVSANLHGRPACRSASEVARAFPGLEMVLDGGPAPGGASSTIVDLTAAPPRILREGLLPAASVLPWLE